MGNGPARSGRRNTTLLAQEPPAAHAPVGSLYVTCARPLRVGEHILPAGVEVPGAGKWVRVEAWVTARRIRKISASEPYIPFEVFEAWVNDESEPKPSLEEFHAQFGVEKIEDESTEE